jgi:hypothetical protein
MQAINAREIDQGRTRRNVCTGLGGVVELLGTTPKRLRVRPVRLTDLTASGNTRMPVLPERVGREF